MGFTALDGMMMGTRCGALDAGVVLHLIGRCHYNADEVERMLYHKSGLLGVSGISNDMRDLLASDAPEAAQAAELFVHRATREIGALSATLGGLDGLVFTAGIGEKSPEIRARIGAKAEWLGVRIDHDANLQTGSQARCISTPDSRIPVWVVPTDEERMIAVHTVSALADALPHQATSLAA
jgi:acetate kinase